MDKPRDEPAPPITITRERIEALYDKAGDAVPYIGRDDWDLNAAWIEGYRAALDEVSGRR